MRSRIKEEMLVSNGALSLFSSSILYTSDAFPELKGISPFDPEFHFYIWNA